MAQRHIVHACRAQPVETQRHVALLHLPGGAALQRAVDDGHVVSLVTRAPERVERSLGPTRQVSHAVEVHKLVTQRHGVRRGHVRRGEHVNALGHGLPEDRVRVLQRVVRARHCDHCDVRSGQPLELAFGKARQPSSRPMRVEQVPRNDDCVSLSGLFQGLVDSASERAFQFLPTRVSQLPPLLAASPEVEIRQMKQAHGHCVSLHAFGNLHRGLQHIVTAALGQVERVGDLVEREVVRHH